jgi:hypothetical protein
VIARSADSKPYVKMGEPYFQIKHKLKQYGIVAFSSSYALYGDMGARTGCLQARCWWLISEDRIPFVHVRI